MAKVLRAIRPFILACFLPLGYTPPGNGTLRSHGGIRPMADWLKSQLQESHLIARHWQSSGIILMAVVVVKNFC